MIFGVVAFFSGCDRFEEEEFSLGSVPTAEDAKFTFSPSAENDNIIEFTSAANGFINNWDLGNGTKVQGKTVTGIYPIKGEYEVTLTVYSDGGSVMTTQTVKIAETDATLLDIPEYNLLTGGAANTEGKTWVIDKNSAGHFGLGPITEFAPIWYAAGPNEKEGGGLYNDTYTFKLDGFAYEWETNGDVYLNGAYASQFPGATESPVGDFTAPLESPGGLSWNIILNDEGYDQLEISSPGFIGYFAGARTYDILEQTENKMVLRYEDTENQFSWYITLVPEGFTPPPPPPPATTTLPVDFEGAAAPPFNGFGGSTYAVVDNPGANDVNGSAKVGQYVKGMDGNWAGIETILEQPLDFNTNGLIKMKVYSPVTGRALFKIENKDNNQEFVEVFADITKTDEWEELTFDFSAAASGVYNKIAIFMDFDNNNGGTFYIDDIRQDAVPKGITDAVLNGGGSKVWVLKPAAGSFGVGPGKGDISWWPGGADISADRPCLFNDEFIFKTGGEYEYQANGDIYAEAYMGQADGCTDESTLIGTDAEAWTSGNHSYSLQAATETDPATITVTGTGAFIALPKAFNGGEYAAAPPTTDGSVTYEVVNYVNEGGNEELTIAVNIGSGYWTFVLIPQ